MTCLTAVSPVTQQALGLEFSVQPIVMERRLKVRYPLVLNLRYRALGPKLHSGEGQAVNLSSGGALVISQHGLGVGEELEVGIEWPTYWMEGFPSNLLLLATWFVAGHPVSPCAFAGINSRRCEARFNQLQPRSSGHRHGDCRAGK